MAAPTYKLLDDYGAFDKVVQTSPHWVVAVVRLGYPLSFDRTQMKSRTTDLTQSALLRSVKPLVITGDCTNLSVTNDKASHTKSMTATLKQSPINYLVEVLPGDWVLAWMVNDEDTFNELVARIGRGDAANGKNDGLKFVGRVHAIDKDINLDENTGTLTVDYQIQGIGFSELDTMFFYDASLASKDTEEKSIGTWLARIGYNVENLFRSDAETGIQLNNVNFMIPTLIDLIVGKGPKNPAGVSIPAGVNGKETVSASPTTEQAGREAVFSYVIPTLVGRLLGKTQAQASKPAVLSYADILELNQGVQSYNNGNSFTPDLDTTKSTTARRVTKTDMLGTFLPFMPEFTNKPLWGVLQQFLNPTVNEIYTCLRTNPEGNVVPTVVLRQIPFTTEAFDPNADYIKARAAVSTVSGGQLPYTKFLTLPRWVIDKPMLRRVHVGRSNATRTNFVHVYGSALYTKGNRPLSEQITNNPPIRDDLDIQRSGLHSYMTEVNCAVEDEVQGTPGLWMALVADWMIGSQYVLTGTITTTLVQSAVAEGDNLEFDNMVFHIEAVSHRCSISASGVRTGSTSFSLTNGMRSDTDSTPGLSDDFPIYPGFNADDGTDLEPGLTDDGGETTGGTSDSSGVDQSQLNPKDTE
jgi:hypothetical protein